VFTNKAPNPYHGLINGHFGTGFTQGELVALILIYFIVYAIDHEINDYRKGKDDEKEDEGLNHYWRSIPGNY
jgi:uncharacterized membrane protein